jgi:molecular chaperone DnaK
LPAPRGVPQIEVTFDIDTNGIVHVSAKDKGTGKEQTIRITAPTKLSQEQIDKMVKEAEKYADTDKKKREEVEIINQANTSIYSTEKSLKDYGDKVSTGDKSNIEKELNQLKEAVKSKDLDKIKQGIESLQKVSHKLAEEVYKSTASQQAAGAGAASGAGDSSAESRAHGGGSSSQSSGGQGKDDIIDADFKAEDDKK